MVPPIQENKGRQRIEKSGTEEKIMEPLTVHILLLQLFHLKFSPNILKWIRDGSGGGSVGRTQHSARLTHMRGSRFTSRHLPEHTAHDLGLAEAGGGLEHEGSAGISVNLSLS